jgi:hypothetical protein
VRLENVILEDQHVTVISTTLVEIVPANWPQQQDVLISVSNNYGHDWVMGSSSTKLHYHHPIEITSLSLMKI